MYKPPVLVARRRPGLPALRRLAGPARSLGVTRLARVTGLDRSGVEVAVAVRPLGHVLQVSNGKGSTFAEAARGALLEAAELAAAEAPGRAVLRWGSPAELEATGANVLSPAELGAAGPLAGARIAWVEGQDLFSGGPTWVPACAVFCPPSGGPFLGPACVPWTSNGMGAFRSGRPALLHALLEAAERDLLARALPSGFTRSAVAAALLDPAGTSRAAPRTWALASRLARRGFEVYLLDLSSPGDLPVGAALLADSRSGPVPLSAGYACALDPDSALRGALLEAAQSRLTDIHGAREDVAPGDRAGLDELLGWCRRARPLRGAAGMPRVSARGPEAVLRAVLRRLRRRTGTLVAVRLPPPAPGIEVVKVVAPGLERSGLL